MTSENVDPKVLYECQKKFFGHTGYDAGIESVCVEHPKEFSVYCKQLGVDVTDETLEPANFSWEKRKETAGGHDAAVQQMKVTGMIYESGDKKEAKSRTEKRKANAIAKHRGDEDAAHQHLWGHVIERNKTNNPTNTLQQIRRN